MTSSPGDRAPGDGAPGDGAPGDGALATDADLFTAVARVMGRREEWRQAGFPLSEGDSASRSRTFILGRVVRQALGPYATDTVRLKAWVEVASTPVQCVKSATGLLSDLEDALADRDPSTFAGLCGVWDSFAAPMERDDGRFPGVLLNRPARPHTPIPQQSRTEAVPQSAVDDPAAPPQPQGTGTASAGTPPQGGAGWRGRLAEAAGTVVAAMEAAVASRHGSPKDAPVSSGARSPVPSRPPARMRCLR